MAHGYIGAQPATTTDIAVVADISESLDISGFTPHITVSSLPSLAVSSITLVEPMAVSGTVTTAAPANQNVSGISLDAIKVATEAIQTDSAANEVLLTAIDTVLDNIKVDTEAIETATEAIQVDAAAIEVLLTGIDADTDAIKTDTAANEVLLTGIDTVLDNILTKNTEIDTVLDTIKVDTQAIETATETIQDLQTNVVDSNNSTTATLAGGATWTGTGTDVLKYAVVATSIKASHDSATDGFAIEFSPDNSNWDESTTFTLEAGVTRRYQYPVTARYYRVKLTNGGSAQSYLRVQTILHADMIPGSIHKVENGTETGDRTCQLVKSVLQAKKPNGDFVNIDATTGGNLKVSVEEVEDVIFPVSGTSLDSIQTATEGVLADTALMVPDLDAIRIDTAANEVLLTGIDAVLDNILTKNTEIDTALDTIDGVLDNVLTKNTEIDAVLDTIKVDTEAIETAVESSVANAGNVLTLHRPVIAPVTGLDVNIKPSTSSYLSHVYIDLDAAGDNPTTNTEVIAAPGASSKLVIYGVQGSIVGSGASDYGNWFLSDGNTAAATTLWTGRAQGTTNTMFELTFPYGVALTTNTALKVTSTEGSGNIFITAVIYYRTEAV